MTEKMKALVLVWNPQNHVLLSEMLWEECELLPPERAAFSEADIIIVDGPAVAMRGRDLVAAKRAAEPLHLPILFIASKPDISRTTRRMWEFIDDVITRPIYVHELRARVRALLQARRLSLRLSESRLMYKREHSIATRLQHAALPTVLPKVPGFEFDGFYEAAGNEAQVGGDWYDAVRLNDGRILVSIGDVAGSGLEAAVTMASVRQAIRAVAQIYADPLTVLDAADRTLKEEQPDRIVTAFVGVIDPVTWTITYASAGHPPPIVRAPDGSLLDLHTPGLPLGLRMRGDGHNAVANIPVGSIMVFFTDGLIEARRDIFDGQTRLHAALADRRVLEDKHLATAIKDAVYDGLVNADDVALLTLRVTEPANPMLVRRWRLHTSDARAAAKIRREFVAELALRGVPPESLFRCELIFGELLGNVVRYAPGETEIVLDMRCEAAVLHFLDKGKGFTLVPRLPTDLLSERGRGLFLIWTLSEDFNVDVRETGGAHARAVLPLSAKLLLPAPAAETSETALEPLDEVQAKSA